MGRRACETIQRICRRRWRPDECFGGDTKRSQVLTAVALVRRSSMSKFSIILFFGLMFGLCAITFGQGPAIPDATYDSVVSVLLAADGKANAVGTGLIVRSDGYVLVPYSVVRGA